MKKRGISLIVLVITILVMIILAGVVVVTMSENNPINKAKEAKFKSNVSTYLDELSMTVANRVLLGLTEKINATGEEVKKYITSISTEDTKKFSIVNNKLVYVGNSLEEEMQAGESGVIANASTKVVWEQDFGVNGKTIDAIADWKNIAIPVQGGSIELVDKGVVEITVKPLKETYIPVKETINYASEKNQNLLVNAEIGTEKNDRVNVGLSLGTNYINVIEHASNWWPFTIRQKGDYSDKHIYKLVVCGRDIALYQDGMLIKKYTSNAKKVGIKFTHVGGGYYGAFKGTIYKIKVSK